MERDGMSSLDHVFVVIMAGGEGTRFAPLSTPERPKQFLQMVGDGTFIQQTMQRAAELVEPQRMYVATNERYVELVKSQLADVPEGNIIAEPVKRNTAPCIAYAARLIQERDPNAIMIVLPSDHVVLDQKRFIAVLRKAMDIAHHDEKLVTLGITPRWPATEYGYIKAENILPFATEAGDPLEVGGRGSTRRRESEGERGWEGGVGQAYRVSTFVEKPDLMTARRYVEEGSFSWNSGMFVWKTSALLAEVALYLPDLHALLAAFDESDSYRHDFFTKARPISIDYGILEKSGNVAVIPCDFGWSDVGTWEGLYKLYKGGDISIAPTVIETMKEVLGSTPTSTGEAL
jgi:mannose-1-phosphate guanylyltransferase